MSDRYSDRYDSYGDSYGDSYEDSGSAYGRQSDAYRSRSSARSSSSSSGAGAYSENRRSSNTAQRQSQAGSDSAYRRTQASSNTTRRRTQGDSSATQRRTQSGSSSAHRRTQADANTTRRRSQADASTRRQSSISARQQSGSASQGRYSEDSAGAYSRSAYGSGSSASHARTVVPAQPKQAVRGSYGTSVGYTPKRSNSKRNAIIVVVVVLAVVLVGVGAAWAYVSSLSQNLHEGLDQETLDALEPASATPTALADTPFYMLLMGIDTSANRVEYEDNSDTTRSDSMILTRVDPVNKKVTMISIHRDTSVDMGEYGEQKINAAYQYWGAAGAIDAVSKMAGVPISHYASVDFDGFRAIVDSLGGIEVDVPMEINDPDADPDYGEGHLDAGLQTLDGKQALILCRSRHAYDEVANDGDVMRAANQRMVIGAIAKKILASDIMTIANTVQTMSKYVTTDLEIGDIVGLAQLFQGIDPDADIYTAMEPTTSAYIDDIWYEFLDEATWSEMISRMEQGLPPVNKNEVDDATGVILSTGGLDAPRV